MCEKDSIFSINSTFLHELPNSTSNINDTHEAYLHFENKWNEVQDGTHIILGKKEKFKFS